MNKINILLFFLLLISIFLTSEAFAFSTQNTTTSQISKSDETSFEKPINQQAIHIEELAASNGIEQVFVLKSFPYYKRDYSINNSTLFGKYSKIKEEFFYKENLKKLLTQRIYPFHLFW